MNDATIGRNYAETLMVLAKRTGDEEKWGALIEDFGTAMRENHMLKTFLESPKIAASQKITIVEKALGTRVPPLFLRFIETVISKRRQMLIPAIAIEYRALIDESEDRVHANVTLARDPGEPERDALARQLSRLFGKRVVPHISLNPAILGGLIVKVGDTVMDGSVRRRLATLRSRMIAAKAESRN
jgi:F-type H+-transporting ATPase subunit delta